MHLFLFAPGAQGRAPQSQCADCCHWVHISVFGRDACVGAFAPVIDPLQDDANSHRR
ncbi:hypothetical protein OOZ54_21140 [Rhodopseudomonas palustris]|uniref:hypothetical protein n=1 Tax=Rhodopseudomonas palustris TaxID=1076 RepID=UPI00167F3297|nr:hypothetical protein [Rhodopseudomonas palustris]WBU29146.1 hypothetical protein OOZ54_21140 [Rhodopseudomonas palustris]